jgi:crotonobetaine/carnitine-CoA ligase
MQSYNNWIRAIVEGASKQYNSQAGDVIYCVLPLFNSAAWITSIFRSLIEGIPCVIESKFSVSAFWDRVKHFGATQTFAIGAMGVFLLNSPEREDDADTPLRKAQIIPMPPQQWQRFEQRFGLKLLRGGLGMSECLQILRQIDDRDDVPVYALGFPPADVEIGLFDDKGHPVADGESGEICVKPLAAHVLFNGYFDNPQATAASYRDGWFLTGDIGRRDSATGAYFYVDRKKDAVRFAGRNISTLEVESVVRQHPSVQDVAAFGIPSSELESEDELMISVVLKPAAELSHEALCAFINDNGPHYFVPRYMNFVESLPYTPTNKVKKYMLRDTGVSDQTWDLEQSDYRVRR